MNDSVAVYNLQTSAVNADADPKSARCPRGRYEDNYPHNYQESMNPAMSVFMLFCTQCGETRLVRGDST